MTDFDPAALDALRAWDTPTICNALELVAPHRRATGFTVEHLHCLDPSLKPMVGFARTGTIRAVEPSPLPADAVKAARAAYYEYVASAPGPTVVVLQDLDPNPDSARSGARSTPRSTRARRARLRDERLDARHRRLRAGLPVARRKDRAEPRPRAHRGFGGQVNVAGMTVGDGDIVHADRHGAVVVPREAVAKIRPRWTSHPARGSHPRRRAGEGFDIDVLKRAMADRRRIH